MNLEHSSDHLSPATARPFFRRNLQLVLLGKMSENNFNEGCREPLNSSVYEVDPGKPASLTWQRKLNSNGNIPSEYTLRFQETMHLAPLGVRLWHHVNEEAAKGRVSIIDPFHKRLITCHHAIPLGGIGKHWKKLQRRVSTVSTLPQNM